MQLMFASFNPSLARTRRMNVTLNNYLFIILLALVVNLSIKAVGALLLINALARGPGGGGGERVAQPATDVLADGRVQPVASGA